MTDLPPGFTPFDEFFPPDRISHHWAGQGDAKGIYAKEIRIPAGFMLASHQHSYDHLSILASGRVRLATPAGVQYLVGPVALTIAKGVTHKVLAITDAIWFCIHPTEETDVDKIDQAIIAREHS